jgi:hypothetical protein
MPNRRPEVTPKICKIVIAPSQDQSRNPEVDASSFSSEESDRGLVQRDVGCKITGARESTRFP